MTNPDFAEFSEEEVERAIEHLPEDVQAMAREAMESPYTTDDLKRMTRSIDLEAKRVRKQRSAGGRTDVSAN